MTNDIQLNTQFDLNALLGRAMEQEEVVSDPEVAQGFNSPIPSFLNIPQMTSSSYPTSVRLGSNIFVRGDDMIVIAERDKTSGEYIRYYTNHLRVALIDVQQTQRGRETLTARTMWPLTEDGQRNLNTEDNQPACRSLNGFGPIPRFLGKEIYHPGTGQMVKIGFNKEGNPYEDMSQVCSRCPFSQWTRGAKPPQPCKGTSSYIIWVAPQIMVKAVANGTFKEVTFPSAESGGMMIRLNGQNTGIELALKGRTEKQNGRMNDGSAIKALTSYYMPNGDMARHYVVPDKLNPAAKSFVVGVAKTKRASDFVPMVWGTSVEGEIESGIKYIVLEVPAYDVYPEGNPLNIGAMTTVLPLSLTVAKNNFDIQKTSIPTFSVDTDNPMTPVEFGSFLSEKMRYNEKDESLDGLTIREQMMGIGYTLSDGNARLNEQRIAISSPQQAALPDGGVIDAEYVDLSDDMG